MGAARCYRVGSPLISPIRLTYLKVWSYGHPPHLTAEGLRERRVRRQPIHEPTLLV